MQLSMTARKPWQHYLIAILAFASAAVIRAEFLGILGPRLPYLTFYPTVMLVAICAGAPAGLLATCLSAIYIACVMSPIGQGSVLQGAADRLSTAIFVMSCAMICLIAKTLHNAQLRAAEADSQVKLAKQRRVNELKLRESAQQYRSLFENSLDAIFLTVPDGKITAANPAACAIFGMSEEEFCRLEQDGVLDRTDPRLPVALKQRADSGKVLGELTCVRKDGSKFSAQISSFILGDTQGSCVILRDLSERKQAEGEILALKAGVEERVRERTADLESFSYSVSHDLRAPLRHISCFSSMLMEDYGAVVPVKARHYLERIGGATRRMGDLIDHMLELSQVSRIELKRESVDLSRLIAGVAAVLQETEPKRCVEFIIEEGLLVQGDRKLLRQLLDNLIGNAWKYSSARPSARIEFGRTCVAGKECFFVKDNGVGFDMAYSCELFEVFKRLHGEEFEGTGIGLTTAKRIIRRHGGSIWAEGKVDHGATFYFSLGVYTATE